MSIDSVYVILRNNSFFCKTAEEPRTKILKLDEIIEMPNVPFYHQLWEKDGTYKELYRNFYKEELSNTSMMSKLIKPRTFVAIPDDALEVDRRMLIEFFLQCGSRSVGTMPECLLMSRKDTNYITVSRTCRMIIISFVKSGKVVDQLYMDGGFVSAEQLNGYVSSLANKTEYGKLPIYLNGEKMSEYISLGCFIEQEELLGNYIGLTKKQERRDQ